MLFVLTNLAIMIMLSVVLAILQSVFGINLGYYSQSGLNYTSLMIFCGVWGMGGAFISLLMSKQMAKWMMRLHIIDPNRASGHELGLVQTVHGLAQKAGLTKMPDVAIYDSPEVNAFATGPSRNNSLVAVSTGLLQRMGKSEVDGVLGHEVAHIANGDMVTMTLIQGVVNACVMFFARILAFSVSNFLRNDEEGGGSWGLEFILVMVFQMLFGVLGMIVVASFSRWREFRADAGGASLAGKGNMIGALQALKGTLPNAREDEMAVASLKISGKASKFMALISTHPPLEDRIKRLQGVA